MPPPSSPGGGRSSRRYYHHRSSMEAARQRLRKNGGVVSVGGRRVSSSSPRPLTSSTCNEDDSGYINNNVLSEKKMSNSCNKPSPNNNNASAARTAVNVNSFETDQRKKEATTKDDVEAKNYASDDEDEENQGIVANKKSSSSKTHSNALLLSDERSPHKKKVMLQRRLDQRHQHHQRQQRSPVIFKKGKSPNKPSVVNSVLDNTKSLDNATAMVLTENHRLGLHDPIVAIDTTMSTKGSQQHRVNTVRKSASPKRSEEKKTLEGTAISQKKVLDSTQDTVTPDDSMVEQAIEPVAEIDVKENNNKDKKNETGEHNNDQANDGNESPSNMDFASLRKKAFNNFNKPDNHNKEPSTRKSLTGTSEFMLLRRQKMFEKEKEANNSSAKKKAVEEMLQKQLDPKAFLDSKGKCNSLESSPGKEQLASKKKWVLETLQKQNDPKSFLDQRGQNKVVVEMRSHIGESNSRPMAGSSSKSDNVKEQDIGGEESKDRQNSVNGEDEKQEENGNESIDSQTANDTKSDISTQVDNSCKDNVVYEQDCFVIENEQGVKEDVDKKENCFKNNSLDSDSKDTTSLQKSPKENINQDEDVYDLDFTTKMKAFNVGQCPVAAKSSVDDTKADIVPTTASASSIESSPTRKPSQPRLRHERRQMFEEKRQRLSSGTSKNEELPTREQAKPSGNETAAPDDKALDPDFKTFVEVNENGGSILVVNGVPEDEEHLPSPTHTPTASDNLLVEEAYVQPVHPETEKLEVVNNACVFLPSISEDREVSMKPEETAIQSYSSDQEEEEQQAGFLEEEEVDLFAGFEPRWSSAPTDEPSPLSDTSDVPFNENGFEKSELNDIIEVDTESYDDNSSCDDNGNNPSSICSWIDNVERKVAEKSERDSKADAVTTTAATKFQAFQSSLNDEQRAAFSAIIKDYDAQIRAKAVELDFLKGELTNQHDQILELLEAKKEQDNKTETPDTDQCNNTKSSQEFLALNQEINDLRTQLEASEAAVVHLEWQKDRKSNKKLKKGAKKLNKALKKGTMMKKFPSKKLNGHHTLLDE